MDLRFGLETIMDLKSDVEVWLMWLRKIISLLDEIDERR